MAADVALGTQPGLPPDNPRNPTTTYRNGGPENNYPVDTKYRKMWLSDVAIPADSTYSAAMALYNNWLALQLRQLTN